MNILVITQMYPQPDDVGEYKPTKTVEYFAREWVDSGNRVIVLHCPSKFPLPFYFLPISIKDMVSGRISTMTPPIESRKTLSRNDNGIDVYRVPMQKLYPGQAYSKRTMKSQTKRLCNLLAANDFVPEVVMGHFANPSLELVVNIAEHFNAKSSIVFHHDCNEKNIQKFRIDKLIHWIGAVGARSIVEAKEIQKLLSLDYMPFICYSGVPHEAIESCDKVCTKHDYKNGIRYIYVGSLLKSKRVDTVITAFSNMYHSITDSPIATLSIVGGGPEFDALNTLVSENNVKDLVTFNGRFPRNQVLQKMRESHIFTMVSKGETFGMVYIEAMLQGCIVIASIGGGFDGIIQNGVNGFLCNPGDATMLEEIYERICNMSAEERNSIGQMAIDTALGFSEKAVAERYLNDVLTLNARRKTYFDPE